MSTEPAPVVLDPIQIEPFEQLVYGRKYEDAIQALFTIITQIKRGHGLAYYAQTPPPIETLYTRIAAAISTIFADPTFALSHEGFLRLMNDHDALTFQYPEETEDEIIPKLASQLPVRVELLHKCHLKFPAFLYPLLQKK